jgi:hypothetical protein
MKVKELIELLKTYDENLEVYQRGPGGTPTCYKIYKNDIKQVKVYNKLNGHKSVQLLEKSLDNNGFVTHKSYTYSDDPQKIYEVLNIFLTMKVEE